MLQSPKRSLRRTYLILNLSQTPTITMLSKLVVLHTTGNGDEEVWLVSCASMLSMVYGDTAFLSIGCFLIKAICTWIDLPIVRTPFSWFWTAGLHCGQTHPWSTSKNIVGGVCKRHSGLLLCLGWSWTSCYSELIAVWGISPTSIPLLIALRRFCRARNLPLRSEFPTW